MQQLDHQQQQHAISVARRHIVSSYRYYSPMYLVPGPIQASHCTAWHLHVEDSHLKTLYSRVKFSERFNSRVGVYTFEYFMERKYCKSVGTRKQFCFNDCGRLRFYLNMRLVALENLSPYPSMHMKNVQIRGHTRLVL
jgi:hypothetical protein